MEKTELAGSDEATPRAIGEIEGDAFAVQTEDWDKQSKGAETQNIVPDVPDDPESINELYDILETHNIVQDEAEISNGQHDKLETQNIVHDESEYSNEQHYISETQNIVHDEPESSNEQHYISETQNIVHDEPESINEQHDALETQNIVYDGPMYSNEQHDTSEEKIGQVEMLEGDAYAVQDKDQEESKQEKSKNSCHDSLEYDHEHGDILDKISSQETKSLVVDACTIQNEDHNKESKEVIVQNIGNDGPRFEKVSDDDKSDDKSDMTDVESNSHKEVKDNVTEELELVQTVDRSRDMKHGPHEENLDTGDSSVPCELFQKEHWSYSMISEIQVNIVEKECAGANVDNSEDFESKSQEVNLENNFREIDLDKYKDENRTMDSTKMNQTTDITSNEDYNLHPTVDGLDVLEAEVGQCTSTLTSDADPGTPHVVEKAVALTNFVREKSVVAVSTLLRHLSRKVDEGSVGNSDVQHKDFTDLSTDSESKDVSNREETIVEGPPQPILMKGRIILYSRLGCQESKEVRQFLYMKRLRYVEINIDVYPSRKMELEKISRSTSVPKVFFNEILIGGLSELKSLNDSGKIDEKIDYLITESPSFEAPFPPLSGEDDVSSSGALDEMALIVRKMKESIVVKDRFSKLRRFTNCFLGSEAVDFLSEDQYLERKEAVEFGRKLASKLFFQHVLDENLFEDGNYLYRFLDDDPIVASQCHNIPRGIITVKPKPITEIASRLRLLSYAMFEAYASEDGRHLDYRSMHGSEEFARYLRIVEELQRVEILDLSREETLAFFINLYNMMTIHAILVWGHPDGGLERRRLFGDFKYVIGGLTYSLSAIQNGILRGNLRPPYTLMKPFGAKDKRIKVALSFPEPLIHFALVYGTRSGPALRCYSPGDIDQELMDATRKFLRRGGLLIDYSAKVAYASKILKWYSVDFGKNEVEVMKHVSIYLDPADSELLFDLLATSELKVIYQPYDWGLNC